MKGISFVLIAYSISMVFYGGLEMTHDILHYLADHHHTTLHSHEHDYHHTVHDHEHHHHDDDHAHLSHQPEETDQDDASPAPINFYLFCQSKKEFSFSDSSYLAFGNLEQSHYLIALDLATPPPRS